MDWEVTYFRAFVKNPSPDIREIGFQCFYVKGILGKDVVIYRRSGDPYKDAYSIATEGDIVEQAKAIAEGRIEKKLDYFVIPDVENVTFCNIKKVNIDGADIQALITDTEALEELEETLHKKWAALLEEID